MSYGRFSYNISDEADKLIEARMVKSGETKSNAINSLIERIPEMDAEIKRLSGKVEELRTSEALYQKWFEQEKALVTRLQDEKTLVRQFFFGPDDVFKSDKQAEAEEKARKQAI